MIFLVSKNTFSFLKETFQDVFFFPSNIFSDFFFILLLSSSLYKLHNEIFLSCFICEIIRNALPYLPTKLTSYDDNFYVIFLFFFSLPLPSYSHIEIKVVRLPHEACVKPKWIPSSFSCYYFFFLSSLWWQHQISGSS